MHAAKISGLDNGAQGYFMQMNIACGIHLHKVDRDLHKECNLYHASTQIVQHSSLAQVCRHAAALLLPSAFGG